MERSAVGADPGIPSREPRFRHQIEPGVSISGRIHFPGDARIDGSLKGEIRAEKLLLIGDAAELQATVSAGHLVLCGTMRGDVVRSGTVELEPTAHLVGNIEARTLVVHPGAFFDGRATIGKMAPTERASGHTEDAAPSSDEAHRRARAS